MTFEEKLKALIAEHSQEFKDGDFILAQYIQRMLVAYNISASQRDVLKK